MSLKTKIMPKDKKRIITSKTEIYHIDDTWSLEKIGLQDYDPEKSRGCTYVLVVKDNFSKLGRIVPLKNENAQTIKNSFENILNSSKRRSKLFLQNTLIALLEIFSKKPVFEKREGNIKTKNIFQQIRTNPSFFKK